MSQPARTASNNEDPRDGDGSLEEPTAKADLIVQREPATFEVKAGPWSMRSASETVVGSPNNRAAAFVKHATGASLLTAAPMAGGHLLGAPGWVGVACGSALALAALTFQHFRRQRG